MTHAYVVNYNNLSERDQAKVRKLCEKLGTHSAVIGLEAAGKWQFRKMQMVNLDNMHANGWKIVMGYLPPR